MASQYAGWAVHVDGLLRDGLGSAARRMRASSTSCSRSWATPRRPSAACSCSRGARCRPMTSSPGSSEGRPRAGGAHVHRSRPRPASPAACRSPRAMVETGPAQDGRARLRRPARRRARSAPRRSRRSRRTTCAPSAARTTACSTAGRRATPCARTTTSSTSSRRSCRRRRRPTTATPFYEIFKRYERDFYKIDTLLFSPAEVWLTSATSGRTFHAGRVNPDRAPRIALRSRPDVHVAILSARTGWHTDELCRALADARPRGRVLPYEALVARSGGQRAPRRRSRRRRTSCSTPTPCWRASSRTDRSSRSSIASMRCTGSRTAASA